jgi:hypothetical protein
MTSDEQQGDDPDAERAADEYDRLQGVLLEHIEDFIQEEDIGEADVADLLIAAAIRLRMAAYGMATEKPSVAGVRLDLDRFRQEVEHILRDAKKGAEEFIDLVKDARGQQAEGPHDQ